MASEAAAICAAEKDNGRRLLCYDRLFAQPQEATSPKAAIALDDNDTGQTPSIMSKLWELGPDDKRGTFVVRTYLPNFLLPLHYTTSINRLPSSQTQPAPGRSPDYRAIEAKLQISLRAKIVEDLFLPGADLWIAYTQRSLWQVWDQTDSAPFRSTDYQPEAI